MGIKGGFATYMKEKWVAKLPDSPLEGKLVFDAMCVLNDLCRKIQSVWHYGGQYWELRKKSKEYFEGLVSKGVEPIVVFDGVDYSKTNASFLNNKKELVMSYSYFLTGKKLPDGCRATVDIRPHFAKAVFCETLKEIEQVQFVFADGDADRAAVSIANHYKCPVVSADSDYFMFNIEGGYAPFDTFECSAEAVKGKVYKFADFAKKFSDETLVFLIPAILGTRSGSIKTIHIQGNPNHDGPFTDYLVSFLKTCSSVKDVTTRYSFPEGRFDKNLDEARKNYKMTEKYTIDKYIEKKAELKTQNGTDIPHWMIINHRKGCLETSVMITLAFSACSLVIVDNPEKESAMNIGKPIRKSIYRILKLKEVREYIRKSNDRIDETTVNAATDAIDLTDKIEALCSVLNTSVKTLDQVADEWKLVALSLHFWINEIEYCNPHIIQSLVLCFVICSSCGDSDPQPLRCCADSAPNKLNILHLFSMWQCVYYEAMKLNDILGHPFSFKSPAFLFDGRLSMHYACMKEKTFDDIRSSKFAASPGLESLYEKLISVCYVKDAASGSSRKSKGKPAATVKQPVSKPAATTNRFAALAQSSDSDDDDDEI